jgi:hypothetical protein
MPTPSDEAGRKLRNEISRLPDFQDHVEELRVFPDWYYDMVNEVMVLVGDQEILYLTGRMNDTEAVVFASTESLAIGVTKIIGDASAHNAEAVPLRLFKRVTVESIDRAGQFFVQLGHVRWQAEIGDAKFTFPLGGYPDGEAAQTFYMRLISAAAGGESIRDE